MAAFLPGLFPAAPPAAAGRVRAAGEVSRPPAGPERVPNGGFSALRSELWMFDDKAGLEFVLLPRGWQVEHLGGKRLIPFPGRDPANGDPCVDFLYNAGRMALLSDPFPLDGPGDYLLSMRIRSVVTPDPRALRARVKLLPEAPAGEGEALVVERWFGTGEAERVWREQAVPVQVPAGFDRAEIHLIKEAEFSDFLVDDVSFRRLAGEVPSKSGPAPPGPDGSRPDDPAGAGTPPAAGSAEAPVEDGREGGPPDPYRGMNLYIGDIHVHTGLALYQARHPEKPHSIGSPDQVIDAADSRGLDFLVITDHSNNMNAPLGRKWRREQGHLLTLPDGTRTESEWDYLKSAVSRLHRPGGLVVFLGLEYTRGTLEDAQPGHQLGIFPVDDLERYCSNFTHNAGDCIEHADFFDFVVEKGGTAVMAHPCERIAWGPSDWSRYHPVINGVELMGGKCEFDRFGYNDVLGRLGHRVGARGSSDSHRFEVGLRNKTACLAPELTRASILEAMKENRCYFLLRQPIDLRFSINGVPMGGEVADDGSGLAVRARASTPWRMEAGHLDLIHNGKTVREVECGSAETAACALGLTLPSGADGYYYVALSSETGRRLAISSPIWVTGGSAGGPKADTF